MTDNPNDRISPVEREKRPVFFKLHGFPLRGVNVIVLVVCVGYILLWSAFKGEVIRARDQLEAKESKQIQMLLHRDLSNEEKAFVRLFDRMNLEGYVSLGYWQRDFDSYFDHYRGEKVYYTEINGEETYYYRPDTQVRKKTKNSKIEAYLRTVAIGSEERVGVSGLTEDSEGAEGFVISIANDSAKLAVWVDLNDWIRSIFRETGSDYHLRLYRSGAAAELICMIDSDDEKTEENAELNKDHFQNDQLKFLISVSAQQRGIQGYNSVLMNLMLFSGIVISGLVLYLAYLVKQYRTAMKNERTLGEMIRIQSSALAHTSIGISITDAQKRHAPIIYINPAYCHITGYNEKELMGKNIRFLLGKLSDKPTQVRILDGLRSHEPVMEEILNYRKDGTPYWGLISIYPIFDSENRVTHYVESLHDITDRKTSEEQFTGAFEYARFGVALVGVEGNWLKVNNALCKMLGYTREALLKTTIQEITHPEDIELSLRLLNDTVQNQRESYQLDKRYLHRDGSTVWVSLSVSSVRTADGRVSHFVSQFQNITDKKQQESALLKQHALLEESNQRYALATRTILMGVLDYSLQKNEILLDWGMKKLYGFAEAAQRISYAEWRAKIHPEDLDRVERELEEAILGVKSFDAYYRVVKGNGGIRHIHGYGEVYRDDTGKANRMVGLNLDVTEPVKRAEELKKAKEEAENANRAKSLFLANMSHEIRTPMNAILGFTDILSRQVTDERQLRNIGAIHSSGKTLLTLINDILDLSKIEAGKLDYEYTPVNLRRILAEMNIMFEARCEEKGIGFGMDVEEALPTSLLLDEIRLRQVLINVIGNAVKFTEKGEIRVIVESIQVDDSSSRVSFDILVKDTGIGMKMAASGDVFDAFFQEKGRLMQGGTGLGLAISKRLIDGMKGSLLVTSKEGEGSVFTIRLREIKIASTVESLENRLPERSEIEFEGGTILIADDVPLNRELLVQYLQFKDVHMIEANNGIEALEKARENLPDVILMDIKMPEMDGIQVIEHLQADAATRKIPVIVISASAMIENETRVRELGSVYLRKPIDRETLYGELAKYLPHKKMEQSGRTDRGLVEVENELKEIENVVALKEALKPFIERMDRLSGSMVMSEVAQVIKELEEVGKYYGAQFILDYCRSFSELAKMFDIYGVRTKMIWFKRMIDLVEEFRENDDRK